MQRNKNLCVQLNSVVSIKINLLVLIELNKSNKTKSRIHITIQEAEARTPLVM